MTQAPTRTPAPPRPAVAPTPTRRPRTRQTRPALALRMLGALTLLAVGAVHLDQYFAVDYGVVPVIGTLFALNFAGATAIGLLLLTPVERLVDRVLGRGGRAFVALLALGGIGLSVTSFVFLFVSETTVLFGFHEYGYRAAILVSLAAEAATTLLLAGYLGALLRNREGRRA